jgi:23S rRNA pseudouridine1911/1915/1917 synthase
MILKVEEIERLDALLVKQLAPHSRSRIEKMIREGMVTIDGEPVTKPGMRLRIGQTVECPVPEEQAPQDLVPVEMPLEILYEDDDVIVLVKQRGIAVHPAPGLKDEATLVQGLLHYSSKLSDEAGSFRPGIVHRLDKDTTGVMMVARTNVAHQRLADQVRLRTAERRYVAGVFGRPDQDLFTVQAPLGQDPRHPMKRAIRSDGKPATTHFRVLGRLEKGTLLGVRLETGRTHQVRVHLASIGLPLLGDRLYSPPAYAKGSLQLHAAWLSFTHPTTEEVMAFFAPPPEDFEGREMITEATMNPWTRQANPPI